MKKYVLPFFLLPAASWGQTGEDSLQQSQTNMIQPLVQKKIIFYREDPPYSYSTNFTNALSVWQSGVQVYSSGAPGSDAAINIRGIADPFGNTKPLVLVDGMPFYGDYSAINTYNIEEIAVEKAPIGLNAPLSMSGNGIINIRTKRAPALPSKWYLNLNANTGFNTRAIPKYNLINDPGEYYEMYWQGLRRSAPVPTLAEAGQYASDNMINSLRGYNLYNVPDRELIDPVTGKLNPNAQLKYADDWSKVLTRVGLHQQYNVSAGKSWKKADLFLSGNYLQEDGYLIKSSFERSGLNLQAHYRPVKQLEIGISGLYSFNKDRVLPEGTAYTNPNFALYNAAPVHPFYERDADGNILIDPNTGEKKYSVYAQNTMPFLEKSIIATRQNNAFLNPELRWFIMPGLELLAKGSYMKWDQHYLNGKQDKESIIASPQLSYSKQWGNHRLKTGIGYFLAKYYNAYKNFQISTTHLNMKLLQTDKTSNAFIEYNYGNQAELKGTVYKDFSKQPFLSRTVSPNWHWALSGAWTQALTQQHKLQLSASYSRFVKSYSPLNPSGALVSPIPVIGYSEFDKDYKGPIQKQAEIKAKLMGWHNRIQLEIGWFRRATEDGFFRYQWYLPGSGTFDMLLDNFGIRNSGLELTLNARVITSRFNWDMGLYATYLQNKITAIPGDHDYDTYLGRYIITEGSSIYTLKTPQYAGIDPQNGAAMHYTYRNGQKIATSDYNSLTIGEDYKLSGQNLPLLTGSLNNNFTYKNLSLQLCISYALGGKAYDYQYAGLMGGDGNYHRDLQQSWTPDNRDATIPALDLFNGHNNAYSSRFVTNASWLNLKYAKISYRLPLKLYRKSSFNNMSVYLSGENLLFFSARKGFNPNEDPASPRFSYQPMRTVLLGVNISL